MLGLSTIKNYVFAVALAALSGGWAIDHFTEKNKGFAQCTEQHQAADTNYVEWKIEQNNEAAKEAVNVASNVAQDISSKEVEKPHAIQKTRDLAVKANTPASCDLTDDELHEFNSSISEANGPDKR